MVRVTHVEVGRSAVEPVDWTPADRAYRAAVVSVPLPPAEVQLDPPVDGGPPAADVAAVHDAVRAAVATAGAGGAPSAAVRVVDDATASPGALAPPGVGARAPGTARLARADGTPVVGDVDEADGAGARLVVSRLEHVAGWELVRALGDHPSPLADLVTLDLFECQPGETRRPARPARRSPPTAAAC